MPDWISSQEARALELARGLSATPSALEKCAKEAGPEAARWAFLQWELRGRARAKFDRADEMLFTRAGLEMASGQLASAFHASLFQSPVLDCGCGIGGDLMAFSAASAQCTGMDADGEALRCAAHNLAVHGLSAHLEQGDFMARDWSGQSVFVDPARRGEGRRTLDPLAFLPPLPAVLAKAASAKTAWIKLSPMLADSVLEEAGAGLIFLSQRRECVEALVEGSPGERGRWAARAETGSRLPAGPDPTRSESAPGWVCEADPAAIRAHALGAFGLESVGEAPGWLASPVPVESEWLVSYRVLWSGPWRAKTVLGASRELGIEARVVKTRGVGEDPAKVRKSVAWSREAASCALLLYRQGAAVRALLAEGPIEAAGRRTPQ